MVTLEQEELKTLATLSVLTFSDAELEAFTDQIRTVLEYMEELNGVTVTNGIDTTRTINVFREDKVVVTDSEPILKEAPETHDGYFIVPRVLD